MTPARRFSFGLLTLVSCGLVFMLGLLNWAMTSLWLQGNGDVYTWATVVAMSTIGLIMLWHVANKAYHRLWQLPKRKEKPKILHHERLEISGAEQEDVYSDEQSKHKSNP